MGSSASIHTAFAAALPLIRCSCCGAPLQPEAAQAGTLLHCLRRRWPVVLGIALLREGPETDRAIEALQSGDEWGAAAFAVGQELRSRQDRIAARLEQLLFRRPAGAGPSARRAARRLGMIPAMGFERTAALLFGSAPWPVPETAGYFRFRRSDPSFVASEAVARIAARGRRTILDAGAGAGHLLASLQAVEPHATVLGLDSLFTALLLARLFVAPRQPLLCVDPAAPLPLASGSCEAVISVDAFFDFPSLPGAASEFARVLAPGGASLLAHLHNRLTPHLYSGRTPLSPEEYRQVLQPLAPLRLFDEAAVLSAVLSGAGAVPERAAEELVGAADLIVCGGSHPTLERLEPLPVPVGPIALNPLYQRVGNNLRRSAHRYTSERESGPINGLLPEAADETAARESLLRERVLLPLPIGCNAAPRGAVPAAPVRRGGRRGAVRWFGDLRSARDEQRLSARLAERAALAYPSGGVAIMVGHRVTARPAADPLDLTITSARLARQLTRLSEIGPIMPLGSAIDALYSGRLSPGLSFALTFDDGTEDLWRHATPLLAARGLTAAVFVNGPEAAPGGRFWWDREGGGGVRCDPSNFLQGGKVWEVGHHGRQHRSLAELDAETLAQELAPLSHPHRAWFAYPFGAPEDAAEREAAAAQAAGFSFALTTRFGIATAKSPRFLLPRVPFYDTPAASLLRRLDRAISD